MKKKVFLTVLVALFMSFVGMANNEVVTPTDLSEWIDSRDVWEQGIEPASVDYLSEWIDSRNSWEQDVVVKDGNKKVKPEMNCGKCKEMKCKCKGTKKENFEGRRNRGENPAEMRHRSDNTNFPKFKHNIPEFKGENTMKNDSCFKMKNIK